MSVEWVRVGDVLELQRTPIEVDPTESYKRIGIYSWGRGMLYRPEVPGSEMGSLRYFTFPAGALMLSNIQAWEAAVAVTTEAEAGYVASNRFLPYVPVTERVDVRYLAHYFVSEVGLEKLRAASPGTQVRNRTLGKKLFEALEIPLPPIEEQRRIADHLDSARMSISSVASRHVAVDVRRAMRDYARDLLSALNDVWRFGEDFHVFGGGTPSNASDWEGSLPWATPSDIGPLRTRELHRTARTVSSTFVPSRGLIPAGSVVMTSRAPLGNLAIAGTPMLTNQGCKSIVPTRAVDPTFLYFSVLSRYADYAEASSGTTFQEISARRIAAVDLPACPRPKQLQLAQHLSRVEDRLWEVVGLQEKSRTVSRSILPAARNEIFTAMR